MALTDITQKALELQSREYTLPGWEPGEDFVCRLRKPTVVGMITAAGFVPNPLMETVAAMFLSPQSVAKIPQDQQAKALKCIAEYALTEPTYEEITEAGLELTDNQYNAIYAYALGGAAGLDRFYRIVSGQPRGDGDGVQLPPVADRAD